MSNINVGVIKSILLTKISNSFLNQNSLNEAKNELSEFSEIISASPILQAEYKIFENLENKCVESDVIATRYIDNNIKLLEKYSKVEINEEHNKLHIFYNHKILQTIDENKINLLNSISSLILESAISEESDVDLLYESFINVLTHVKTNKKEVINEVNDSSLNEHVVEIAITKFNEKYDSTMDDSDRNLFKTLVNANKDDKLTLLEAYKTETIALLEMTVNDEISEKIEQSIQKINEITYGKNTVIDDIIKLHELKKNLI